MRAHNLSHDTYVRDDQVAEFRARGVPMTEIVVEDMDRVHHFVKPSVFNGMIPRIAEHLLSLRSAVKSRMKSETSDVLKALCDGKQKALKVRSGLAQAEC